MTGVNHREAQDGSIRKSNVDLCAIGLRVWLLVAETNPDLEIGTGR